MLREMRIETFLDIAENNVEPFEESGSTVFDEIGYLCEGAYATLTDIFYEWNSSLEDYVFCEAKEGKAVSEKKKDKTKGLLHKIKTLVKGLGNKLSAAFEQLKLKRGSKIDPKTGNREISRIGYMIENFQSDMKKISEKLHQKVKEFSEKSLFGKAITIAGLGFTINSFTSPKKFAKRIIAIGYWIEIMVSWFLAFKKNDETLIVGFADTIQKNIDQLDETTIYESDRIFGKMVRYINTIQTRCKVIYNKMNAYLASSVKSIASDVKYSSDKKHPKADKILEVSKKMENDSTRVSDKYEEYKMKKAYLKFKKEGGKALTKKEVKLLKQRERGLEDDKKLKKLQNITSQMDAEEVAKEKKEKEILKARRRNDAYQKHEERRRKEKEKKRERKALKERRKQKRNTRYVSKDRRELA